MGTSEALKKVRVQICKMLDECQGCTRTSDPKLMQIDMCKTCNHWANIQEQRILLENLQRIYRNPRCMPLDQIHIS